jgi:hypothetical protein
MIAFLRRIPGLVALVLQVSALAGGPGLTLLEAWEHTHRSSPGHGFQAHYEARGGQDHDDVCRIWRSSAPAPTPEVPATRVRLPDPTSVILCGTLTPLVAGFSHRLPPSRAPPLPTL